MARECARKRHERRFGKSERLADVICSSPFVPGKWALPETMQKNADQKHWNGAARTITEIRSALPRVKIVDASNIADFTFSHTQGHKKFNWESLCIRPPFDEMWIESAAPSGLGFQANSLTPWPNTFPHRFGFFIQHGPAHLFLEQWQEMIVRNGFKINGASTSINLIPFLMNQSNKAPCYIGCSMQILLNERGQPTDRPISSMDQWHGDKESSSFKMYELLLNLTSFTIIHSLIFMNCKNVVTTAIEPDVRLNRERQKGGLQPFLRYHTINIEPMKTVLKTEGNIEANGLEKALHLVRGHFAEYKADSPLFGNPKLVGKFFVPSHVRGSAKQGVIFSDYQIHPPKGGSQ